MTTSQVEATQFPFDIADSLGISTKYAELRKRNPVVRIELPFGGEGWLVTNYVDTKMVLADPRFSRAATIDADVPRLSPMRTQADGLLSLDPPDHTRLRRLVAGAFTQKRVQHWRPRTEGIVQELIDGMRAKGAPVDLVDNFGMPLPVTVICELLGVPAQDRHFFQHFTQVLLSTTAATPEEIDGAATTLQEYLAEHIRRHRDEPADDLLTDLISARDNDDRLSEPELVNLGVGILAAGHETTANMTSSFVFTLLNTGLWAELVEHPEWLDTAIEELLRYVAGGPSGQARIATEDLEISGQLIRKGDAVLTDTISANRDDAVFDRPDEIELLRPRNPHLAFGHGAHHCLGAPLARVELRAGIGGLLREFPGLRFATSADDVPWRVGTLVQGPREMLLSW